MMVNGWTLYAYPLFEEQLQRLTERVKASAKADPSRYQRLPATKLLATIYRYVHQLIPADPGAAEFRQGNTLGKDNRHWFRAKFHERYRLFFRFSTKDWVIVYAWVNDESTLRKSGAKSDPYVLFRGMLESGRPPVTMEQLMATSRALQRGRIEDDSP